ncbi:hypothetical protein ACFX11_043592 [Malus domestica]
MQKSRFTSRKTWSCQSILESTGLLRDARDGVGRVEEAVLLVGVLNVRFEKEVVRLGMDVLNGDLEPVEGVGLNDLDLLHKPLSNILKDNAIGGSEEGREYAR